MKRLYIIILLALGPLTLLAQTAPTTPADTVHVDTVMIEVGKSSILFIIRDKDDLRKLQSYDLNTIVDELHLRLDPEGAQQMIIATDTLPEPSTSTEREETTEYVSKKNERPKGISHYFNIELGLNNYLSPNGFPDETNAPYTVKPWGSWYIALGSMNETFLSPTVSLQFGANVSWYNFKFQNKSVYVIRGEDEVEFPENPEMLDVNFRKSKLTVAYVNISLVPMFNFGRKHYDGWRVWDSNPKSGFRIGLGGYGGYRIGSYHKIKYKNDGTEKNNDHDSFYLENFRYGLRLQLGFRDTDVFFNYDLNNLFRENRGPELNAFSFGVIF